MIDRRRFMMSTVLGASGLALPTLLSAQEVVTDPLVPEAPVERDMSPKLVRLDNPMPAGQIHVVPDVYSLYWTLPNGEALRYYVGVGRDALYIAGEFTVGAKKEWPSWTPTKDMIEREPDHYAQYKDGMPGGPDNPLGARALYLFQPQIGDTFLRIHGTNKPDTIRTDVSNGCARLVNEQVIDLYDRVPVGSAVFLYEKGLLPKAA
ncbi:L,D-transpeptidase catalytic domain [Loktanella atrilutea]|uniref:L,D-transpeptidase catalytic domain n=1 Tax=Loktanella atrilutea TaxID=366533 RepID=A0A1M4SZA8_LOKAT|nr:L,D-transpeptidase [Loktanella atrilutea]SHE37377.1 L,D-transpeptidase catalytic domain [Loktanella atrilutea]